MNKRDNPCHLYFVGLGGIGMSAIAEVLLKRGYKISGSDLNESSTLQALKKLGATVFMGHEARHILESEVVIDAVVMSSAIKSGNPELVAARMMGIPVVKRAEMLAEIMRDSQGIVVAGTHGKTTTSSMIAHILLHEGWDPTVVLGGVIKSLESPARAGHSLWVVAESDESDGSFNMLPFTWGVVTNIDLDHMEYFKNEEVLKREFLSFIQRTPFFGKVWLWGDDERIQMILPQVTKPHVTYGFTKANQWVAEVLSYGVGDECEYRVLKYDRSTEAHVEVGIVVLSVLGRHNVLNSLAALGVALELGIPFKNAAQALKTYSNVKRRFEKKFEDPQRNILIIDDYGHHPTEILAVLETAKVLQQKKKFKKIKVVFQPHRYSRTLQCWNDFFNCFIGVDELILLPIYNASENAIEGISHERLGKDILDYWKSKNIKGQVTIVQNLEGATQQVIKNLQPDEMVITLGAGSVTQVSEMLIKALS